MIDLSITKNQIAEHAEAVKQLFLKDCNPRVTIIVQNDMGPNSEPHSGDLVVTEVDDLDSLSASIQALKERKQCQ